MAATNEQRALEHIAKAQKLMKKSFWTSADPQGASEHYEKAANLYKLEKSWEKAGEALERCAECLEAGGSAMSSGRQFQAAAVCYKNGQVADKATEAYKKAVGRYTEEGKFSQAGNAMRDLSEQQAAAGESHAAFESLTSAIEYLETAGTPAVAAQLKSKAADLAMDCSEFATAADLFEAIARNVSIPSSALEPLFKASLCHLSSGDAVAASKHLDRYVGLSLDFGRSPECSLVDSLIQALETSDREAFSSAIQTYESKSRRLDPLKKRLIAQAGQSLPKEDDELL